MVRRGSWPCSTTTIHKSAHSQICGLLWLLASCNWARPWENQLNLLFVYRDHRKRGVLPHLEAKQIYMADSKILRRDFGVTCRTAGLAVLPFGDAWREKTWDSVHWGSGGKWWECFLWNTTLHSEWSEWPRLAVSAEVPNAHNDTLTVTKNCGKPGHEIPFLWPGKLKTNLNSEVTSWLPVSCIPKYLFSSPWHLPLICDSQINSGNTDSIHRWVGDPHKPAARNESHALSRI